MSRCREMTSDGPFEPLITHDRADYMDGINVVTRLNIVAVSPSMIGLVI